jgi:hypothetical protein
MWKWILRLSAEPNRWMERHGAGCTLRARQTRFLQNVRRNRSIGDLEHMM